MFSKLPRTGRKAGIDVCLLLENSTACQKSVPKYPSGSSSAVRRTVRS